MKRIIASVVALVIVGTTLSISHESAPRKVAMNDQPQSISQVETQPAPVQATPTPAAPAPETTQAAITPVSDGSAEPPAAPGYIVQKSGIGFERIDFTTDASWTVVYNFQDCRDGSINLTTQIDGSYVNHETFADSGGGSWGPLNGIGAMELRVVAPPTCSWSLTIQ